MNRWPRRRFLAASTGLATSLAGCTGSRSSDPLTATPEETPPSPPTDSLTPEPTETEAPTPDHEALQWWFDTGGTDAVTPAVGDGTVYVGSTMPVWTEPGTPPGPAHHLYALDATDGTERWAFETGTPVQAAAVHGESVYVVSGVDFGLGGRNYAIDAVDAATGTHEWRFALDESLYLNLLAVTDESVFLGTGDDEISPGTAPALGFDAETGKERWRIDYGDVFFGAASDDYAFLDAPDGLYGVDAEDGTERWRFGTEGFGFFPTVVGDSLYAEHDGLVALDPATGETRWHHELDDSFVTRWTVTDRIAVAGTYDGGVRALDSDTGELLWELQLNDQVRAVAVTEAVAFAGDRTGGLVAVDPRSGSERWSRQLDTTGVASASTDGDAIVVRCDERTALASFDAADGSERWRFEPGGELADPVLADGRVLVGGETGYLYALSV